MKIPSLLLCVALVGAWSCSGAGHVQAASVAETSGVKWNDLTATERRQFDRFVNREVSPCGGLTLAKAAGQAASCPLAPYAVRFAAERLMAGDTIDEIGEKYLRRFGKGAEVRIETGGAPWLGPRDAAVVIVIFSDFQCPHCARAARQIKEIVQMYGPRVAVAFKHYPLPSHPNARQAAQAAQAAEIQGCFWPYHDRYFENQADFSWELVAQVAQEAGCNPDRLKSDAETSPVRTTVDADVAEAERLSLPGTPALFVNGRYLEDGIKTLPTRIDEELIRLGKTPPSKP